MLASAVAFAACGAAPIGNSDHEKCEAHGDPATSDFAARVDRDGGRWTLENGALRLVVSHEASAGAIHLTSFCNKLAGKEYLAATAGAERSLFHHRISADGKSYELDSGDGTWGVVSSTVTDMDDLNHLWGKKLEISVRRDVEPRMTIKLVFEVYDDTAGLRYQTLVTDDEPAGTSMAIESSDVLRLDIDRPTTIDAAVNNLDWLPRAAPSLADGRRNLIATYDDHGFAVNLESNYSTSMATGSVPHDRAQTGDQRHSFLTIDGWSSNENVIRVATDPAAVRLSLRGGETVEYFAIDLSVFTGDAWDARMAIAEQLRARYKFVDPSRVISVDDWLFAGDTKKRDDRVYRDTILPPMVAAGVDRLLIDDFWDCGQDGKADRRSATACRLDGNPTYTFTNDLPGLAADLAARGLQMGYWWSLTGQQDSPDDFGSGGGADLSDPSVIDSRIATWTTTFLPASAYRAKWQQVDLGETWMNPGSTVFATPEDSVYRKWLGLRRYMNSITHEAGETDFLMQTTCELENGNRGFVYPDGTPHWESLGLLALADNGIAGLFWGQWMKDPSGDIQSLNDPPRSAVKTAFAYLGVFPSEGMYDYYSPGSWTGDIEQYYEFLLSRHVGIYGNPADWTTDQIARFRRFNDWRKSPRIRSVLNELLRPLFNSTAQDGLAVGAHGDPTKNDGPYAWMFTDRTRTRAIIIAVGGSTTTNVDVRQIVPRLRWLNGDQRFFVSDISIENDGGSLLDFKGTFGGAERLPIDFGVDGPRAKAFWLQERTSDDPQVIYADENVYDYSESWDGRELTIHIDAGVPQAAAALLVWSAKSGSADRVTVMLDETGTGSASLLEGLNRAVPARHDSP